MATEFNFYGKTVSATDLVLFMGPLGEAEDGPFKPIEFGWSLAHIMHAAGIFPSVGQAKKNNWDKPIPAGYSEYTVTKRKVKIYILTRFD